MNPFDEDAILLKRHREGDELALKSLIGRHQRRIFSLVFYCVGCDPDKAYEITVSSFVDAVRQPASSSGKVPFLPRLLLVSIQKARGTKFILSPDQANASEPPEARREMLKIVKRALLQLSFDSKVTLLLRDQLHLPYEDIASILETSSDHVKAKLLQARAELREKIEGMVSRPESL